MLSRAKGRAKAAIICTDFLIRPRLLEMSIATEKHAIASGMSRCKTGHIHPKAPCLETISTALKINSAAPVRTRLVMARRFTYRSIMSALLRPGGTSGQTFSFGSILTCMRIGPLAARRRSMPASTSSAVLTVKASI